MSHPANDEIYDRARECMEYFTGTMWERIIQRDLDTDDLESLMYHVNLAEGEIAMNERPALKDFPDVY